MNTLHLGPVPTTTSCIFQTVAGTHIRLLLSYNSLASVFTFIFIALPASWFSSPTYLFHLLYLTQLCLATPSYSFFQKGGDIRGTKMESRSAAIMMHSLQCKAKFLAHDKSKKQWQQHCHLLRACIIFSKQTLSMHVNVNSCMMHASCIVAGCAP
jgi:hypothetical protein